MNAAASHSTKNLTIALLALSAAILTALLFATYLGTSASDTRAEMSIRHQRYIITTGELSASEDLVYVLDISTQRLIAYSTDERGNRLERLAGVELQKLTTFAGQ